MNSDSRESVIFPHRPLPRRPIPVINRGFIFPTGVPEPHKPSRALKSLNRTHILDLKYQKQLTLFILEFRFRTCPAGSREEISYRIQICSHKASIPASGGQIWEKLTYIAYLRTKSNTTITSCSANVLMGPDTQSSYSNT